MVKGSAPERIVVDRARCDDDSGGTLKPEVNTDAIRAATEEYNAPAKGSHAVTRGRRFSRR